MKLLRRKIIVKLAQLSGKMVIYFNKLIQEDIKEDLMKGEDDAR